MPFIIDGHNLLWAIQNTSEDSEPVSDVQLCMIISGYLKMTGEKGEIVFDGTGPRDKDSFNSMGNLEVFFAGRSIEADAIIEDKIEASTAPKGLTVVSSDRRVRDAARARKAIALKSQEFWGEVQKQLSRKLRIKEPPEKRRGISESETKQWLKYFGLEQ